MKKIIAATAAVLMMGLTAPSFAGDISVEGPWARASAKMARAGAAFMTIKNMGEADKLIAAKADISKKVELHTHIKDGDVMKMRKVKGGITVPAKGMAMLKPGGDHVMFMGLSKQLKEGEMFPLTLVFEKAGEVKVHVKINKAGAMGAMKHDMKGHMKH